VTLKHQHSNAGRHAAEPGEAIAEPLQEAHRDIQRMMPAGPRNDVQRVHKFADILQFVPQLGADHSGDHDQRDHVQRISIHAVTGEVLVQHVGGGNSAEPQQ
jgi:hypothetical protein